MRTGTLLYCVAALVGVAGCASEDQDMKTLPVAKNDKVATGVTMSKAEISEKSDVPIYPGATVPDGACTVTPSATETRYGLVMTTPDSIDKVTKFYRSKMPGLSALTNPADLMGTSPKKALLHITVSSKAGKTTINVTSIVESPPK